MKITQRQDCIADMSSVLPEQSKHFAELAAQKGCPFLDSPVSGGELGAISGTLAFMIGGSEEVVNKMRDGFAGSRVLDEKVPMMYSRNFKPGGTIAINLKDITNVMDTAKSLDVPLVMTGTLQQIMLSLKASGHLTDDHSGIVQFYKNISGVEVQQR